MSNLPLIQRGFAALPPTITERFFRADSACYEEKILKWLAATEREDGPQGTIGFSISADMSEGLRRVCAAVPEPSWQLHEERATETVMCADVEFTPGSFPLKDAEPLRYVALRGSARGKGSSSRAGMRRSTSPSSATVATSRRWRWCGGTGRRPARSRPCTT